MILDNCNPCGDVIRISPKDFIKNPLLGYVGIRICDNQTQPDSGTWINTLPGISLLSLSATATTDQGTAAILWIDTQNEAWLRFKIDFQNEISKCFKLRRGVDYGKLIADNKELILPAWRFLLGTQLMQYRIYSDRLNRFTLISDEEAQDALTYYTAQYIAALEQAVQLVDYSAFAHQEPSNNPRHVTWLP